MGNSQSYKPNKKIYINERAVDITSHARTEGAANRPLTSDSDLDEIQRVITNHFTSEHEQERKRAFSFLDELRGKCEHIRNTILSETPERLRLEVKTAIDPSPQDLSALQGLLEEKDKHVRNHRLFKKDNELHRAAVYPENRTNHILIILIMIFLESIFNAFLMANASDHGFIGGALQALAISGCNVLMGLITGIFVLPEINHVKKFRRFLGILGTLVFIFAVITFNLLAGHYRDLLTIDPDGALQKTVSAFQSSPCGLSFQSWILFGLGFLVSCISLADGYSLDDSYPNFGKVERALQTAKYWVRNKCAEILGKVRGQSDAAIIKCRDKISHLKTLVPLFKQHANSAKEAVKSFESATRIIQQECNEMLRGYREQNKGIRTSPAPAYFDSYPDMLDSSVPGYEWMTEENTDSVVRLMKKKIEELEASETGLVDYALELQKKTADEFHRFASEESENIRVSSDREEKLLKQPMGGGFEYEKA